MPLARVYLNKVPVCVWIHRPANLPSDYPICSTHRVPAFTAEAVESNFGTGLFLAIVVWLPRALGVGRLEGNGQREVTTLDDADCCQGLYLSSLTLPTLRRIDGNHPPPGRALYLPEKTVKLAEVWSRLNLRKFPH